MTDSRNSTGRSFSERLKELPEEQAAKIVEVIDLLHDGVEIPEAFERAGLGGVYRKITTENPSLVAQ